MDHETTPSYRLSTVELQSWAATQTLPDISASAALIYDLEADTTLLARNAEQSLPMASLTKLMTALLVLEAGNLQAPVTVQGIDLIGDSSMGIQVGEVLTLENLLYGLLINSGNDAAMSLARALAGDVDSFVQRMNQRAAELGLTATHFVNPNGLDAEGHVSSANDLLTLTLKLWEYPLFREIVGTANVTIAGHPLLNTNEFLGVDPTVNGVKTGTTDWAGQCLLTGVLENNRQRLIVVLGSSDRYADTRSLIAIARRKFPWVIPNPWQLSLLNRFYKDDGTLYLLRPSGELPAVMLTPLTQNTLVSQRKLFSDTIGSGQAGVIEWSVGGTALGTLELK